MDGAGSASLARHRERRPPYLGQSDQGMMSCETKSVQVRDTAFTVLAVVDAGLANDDRFKAKMTRAHDFLDVSQLREDLGDPYRQRRKGGWTFSTKDKGDVVSDCFAESMKAVIMIQEDRALSKILSKIYLLARTQQFP